MRRKETNKLQRKCRVGHHPILRDTDLQQIIFLNRQPHFIPIESSHWKITLPSANELIQNKNDSINRDLKLIMSISKKEKKNK